MTEFLDQVFHSPRLARAMRCGCSVLCMRQTPSGEWWFTARDDGWYGWLEVEHDRRVEGEAIHHVHEFIRAIERNKAMFRFEINESLYAVRAVFQLPISIENRFEDDIPAAIRQLVEEWTIFVPFVTRVLNGEDAEQVAAEAKRSFDAYDAKNWNGIDSAALTDASTEE